MADLTQTAANVRSGSNAQIRLVQAGGTITAGMPVYKDGNDKYQAADANAGATESTVVGIALMNASADEYLVIQTAGDIVIGATTTTGEVYILSATAGKIAPADDLTTGWYPVFLGAAKDTSGTLALDISVGTVAHS